MTFGVAITARMGGSISSPTALQPPEKQTEGEPARHRNGQRDRIGVGGCGNVAPEARLADQRRELPQRAPRPRQEIGSQLPGGDLPRQRKRETDQRHVEPAPGVFPDHIAGAPMRTRKCGTIVLTRSTSIRRASIRPYMRSILNDI